jgi:hypothetical protein
MGAQPRSPIAPDDLTFQTLEEYQKEDPDLCLLVQQLGKDTLGQDDSRPH